MSCGHSKVSGWTVQRIQYKIELSCQCIPVLSWPRRRYNLEHGVRVATVLQGPVPQSVCQILVAKAKLAHTLPHSPQAPVFGASTKSDSGRPTLDRPASSPDQAIRIIELTSVQHSIQDTSHHQRRRTSVPATAVTVLQYQTTTAGGELRTPGVLELREDAMRNVNESST